MTLISRAAILGTCALTLMVGVADFVRVRTRVPVALHSESLEQRVPFTDAGDLPASALIATVDVENRSVDRPLTVSAELPGATTGITIDPQARGQLELIWTNARGSSPPNLTVKGSHPDWHLAGVVVSNARGFTRGIVSFAIVPRSQDRAGAPAWTWLFLAVAAAAILRGPRAALTGTPRMVLLVIACATVTLFAATIASSVIGPYRVILDPRSYVLGLLLLSAPWIAGAALAAPSGSRVKGRALVTGACALAGVAFFAAVMFQELQRYGGNHSGFLRVTHESAGRAPFLAERPDLKASLILYDRGYDGQFMYLMAFDPWLTAFPGQPERYRDVVDFPPYRFGRIAYSALTRALSGGDAHRFPGTMLWLVLLGHLVLGAALVGIAARSGAPPWTAAWYLLIPGYMSSLTFGLPESLATGGLALGVYLGLAGRLWAAAVAFGFALLVRETGILLVVAAMATIGSAGLKERIGPLFMALAPLAGWRLYVGERLFADWGWRGFAPSPGNFKLPFLGLGELFTAVLNGVHPEFEVGAAVAYPILLCVAAAIAVATWLKTRNALAVAAIGYGVIAVSLDYEKTWMHVPSSERATIELFVTLLLIGILSYRDEPKVARRILMLWPALAIYTFFISPEAAAARAGLLLIR